MSWQQVQWTSDYVRVRYPELRDTKPEGIEDESDGQDTDEDEGDLEGKEDHGQKQDKEVASSFPKNTAPASAKNE